MAKPKSCKNCKWLWDFDSHEYTGKCCAKKAKNKIEPYRFTVHEKKDLEPCKDFERK